jgi:hypothetical protein
MLKSGVILILAIVTLLAPVAASGQSIKLLPSGSNVTVPATIQGKRLPVWSGGAFLVAEGTLAEPSSFAAYDRMGRVISNIYFSIPEASHTFVHGFTRGEDGIVAVCGASYASDGRGAPFIGWVSSDGMSQHLIRTEPYHAILISVAPDGTFWTIGYELNPDKSKAKESPLNPNAGLLRHFDRTGRTLGSFVPGSTVSNISLVLADHSNLAASAVSVGWLSHNFRGDGAYVEVTQDGRTETYPLPQLQKQGGGLLVDGIAMTEMGDVFVAMRTAGAQNNSFGVFTLDRATRQWSPIPIASAGIGEGSSVLFGANGSELVFHMPADPPSMLRFFKPTK